jgi:hypothetical protein
VDHLSSFKLKINVSASDNRYFSFDETVITKIKNPFLKWLDDFYGVNENATTQTEAAVETKTAIPDLPFSSA